MPDGTPIMAPKSMRTVRQHCVEIWSSEQGNTSASRDTTDGADSADSSTGSQTIPTKGPGSSEPANSFSSTEVSSTCAQYAMTASKLGFLTKGVLSLTAGLERYA